MVEATNADKAESTAKTTGAAVSKPIAENEHVQELYNILKDNNSPALGDFLSIVKQIGAMEANLQSAVTELAAMRTQLAEMEASNHPFRNALQKAVIATQAQVLEIRDKLSELKEQFIEGCKNAVQSFKEKGISALVSTAYINPHHGAKIHRAFLLHRASSNCMFCAHRHRCRQTATGQFSQHALHLA
jgi:uncharacterized protein (DUF3084 family)